MEINRILRNLSLIRLNDGNCSMNRLLQYVVKDSQKSEKTFKEVFELVIRQFEYITSLHSTRKWLIQAESILALHLQGSMDLQSQVRLLYQAGLCKRALGEYHQALNYILKSGDICIKTLPLDLLSLASIYNAG